MGSDGISEAMSALGIDPLYPVFHGTAFARQVAAMAAKTRFAYYTTAETAAKILTHQELWLRMPTCMNDQSEVYHGRLAALEILNEEEGRQLLGFFNELYPGIGDELLAKLDENSEFELLAQTYIGCLSEHAMKPEEDLLGRLSMWRAYGGGSGVALVIKGDPLFTVDSGLNVYSSPVEYLDRDGFRREVQALIGRLASNRELVSKESREQLLGWLYQMMTMAMLCVKHPAFEEEREWRLFHSLAEPSPHMVVEVETIRGVVQPVVKLPLRPGPAGEPTGRSLPEILDKVLIGPTEFPLATATAFVQLLEQAGVPDAARKVHVTGIPLRQTAR